MKPSSECSPFEDDFIHRLCERNPALARLRRVSNEFQDIITHNRSSELASWLKEACTSEIAVFAEGLKKEEPAIRAAVALKWSNGQTEGHVNRLKMLKRQMYGRANVDLLRIRLLSDRFLQQSAA
jgi:transposase